MSKVDDIQVGDFLFHVGTGRVAKVDELAGSFWMVSRDNEDFYVEHDWLNVSVVVWRPHGPPEIASEHYLLRGGHSNEQTPWKPTEAQWDESEAREQADRVILEAAAPKRPLRPWLQEDLPYSLPGISVFDFRLSMAWEASPSILDRFDALSNPQRCCSDCGATRTYTFVRFDHAIGCAAIGKSYESTWARRHPGRAKRQARRRRIKRAWARVKAMAQ